MIDALSIWRTTLNALPKVSDNSWAPAFAAWVADRVSVTGASDGKGIEPDPLSLGLASPPPGGFVFTFNEASFATELQTILPTTDPLAGITSFATAWENAINTVIFPTFLNVTPGAFIPPSNPTSLFSAIISVTIDPLSVTAAKAKIIELASSTPVSDPNLSDFPVKFREAFLLLTITITGLDSTTPTPVPLIAANVPLI